MDLEKTFWSYPCSQNADSMSITASANTLLYDSALELVYMTQAIELVHIDVVRVSSNGSCKELDFYAVIWKCDIIGKHFHYWTEYIKKYFLTLLEAINLTYSWH